MKANQFFLKNFLIFSLILGTIPIYATTYEDAEDNATTGWAIYGDTTDATIENVEDMQRGNRVIQLRGNERRTGYSLGNRSGRASYLGAWHNKRDKVLQWSMKYDEPFRIYIPITTKNGNRYLTYTNQSIDTKGKIRGGKVNYGLGEDSVDGTWHTFKRDLEADWNTFKPENPIISVNGFFIKGSGRVDDISLLSEEPPITNHIYEDAEDNTTTGWAIYGDTTDATIENVKDMQRGNRVIQLRGNERRTGYSLGNRSGRASYLGAWHNKRDKVLQWSMRYDEPFRIYIPITTKNGNRYLTYTNQSIDTKGKIRGGKVNHGLGEDSIDGRWHTFTRDLEADWNEFMPDNPLLSINGFFIKGSGRVDDIMSLNNNPTNH